MSGKERYTKKIGDTLVEIVVGDITEQDTESIVDAANEQLAPGGGVAGAIFRKAGPELWEETKKLGGCATGEAKISGGYRLKAKYVIHTVGPVYHGTDEDAKLLRQCYINSLRLAVENGIKSVSFPAISTGVFGYPMEDAAKIAFRAVSEFIRENPHSLSLVRFVLYRKPHFDIHKKVLEKI